MSLAFSVLYAELATRLNDPTNLQYSVANCKRYINGAITEYNARGGYEPRVDETKVVIADTYEYALPTWVTEAQDVKRISVRQGAAATDPFVKKTEWHVTGDITSPGGVLTFKVVFPGILPESVGNIIRIEGETSYPALTADTDKTDVPSEFIYEYGM